jgi:hypothetical protein
MPVNADLPVAVRLQLARRVQRLTSRQSRLGALTYIVGALLRSALGLAFFRRRQLITVQPIRFPDSPGDRSGQKDAEVDCLVVDSVAGLAAVSPRFPPEFRDSAHRLQRRLGQGCVLTLARRRDANGVSHVVGYELAERGVFSALGRRRPASADVIFSHWAEVLPAYRGRRIHGLLFATRDAYFGARGAKIVVGVVSPKNRASLRALERAGSSVAGDVQRVELFGGVLAWDTPWERIDRVLQAGAVSRTSEPSAPPLRLSSPETPR